MTLDRKLGTIQHRNLRVATRSIRRNTFESVRDTWAAFPQYRSKFKIMLITFFDTEGPLHTEFLPQGHNMCHIPYKTVLQRLRYGIFQKPHNVLLQYLSSVPPQCAVPSDPGVTEFSHKHIIPVDRHFPYSPDLASYDVFLFPRLNVTLKWK
jgi:hypothetical protein